MKNMMLYIIKNSGYSQSEVTKLIKIYHMAMAAGDNVTVQDAYTKIYFFIAKYVYKTLWAITIH